MSYGLETLAENMIVCVLVTHSLACLNGRVVQFVQYFRYRSLPSHRMSTLQALAEAARANGLVF